MGVNPKGWGPWAWRLLHAVCARHDCKRLRNTDMLQQWIQFFLVVLMCSFCRESVGRFRRQKGTRIKDIQPGSAYEWSYTLHNKVNDKLRSQGAVIPAVTLKSARRRVQDLNSRQGAHTFFMFSYFVLCNLSGSHRRTWILHWIPASMKLFQHLGIQWAYDPGPAPKTLSQLEAYTRLIERRIYARSKWKLPREQLDLCRKWIV